MRWIFPEPCDVALARELASRLNVPAFTSELLLRRGFSDPDAAAFFLDPRLRLLRDPFLLPDMEPAVTRLLRAIDEREKVVLYGDYDVDGVTSLSLLTRVLRAYGVQPACFLPHRVDEGYGLSAEGIARCLEEHQPRLLVALDCGTTSKAEIARLREQGVDAIVVDHHECSAALPECVALVNPRRSESDHHLCTVGLVFKFAHALLKRRPLPGFDLRDLLDLVALGTVADLVPLIDENRILVKHGLVRIASSRWVGVRALVEVAALQAPIAASHVAFALGPRLNAAGRLGTALDALQLLLTDDASEARNLARSLDEQNRDRRALEERVFTEAERQLASWFDPAMHAAIVVGSPEWHPGVVGIVASRVQKRYHRPTIVVGFDAEGLGKGSGRSIQGLCLVTALGRCAEHLLKYGGHAMAAGLSVSHDQFPRFCEAFQGVARNLVSEEMLVPALKLDTELSFREIDSSFLSLLSALEPFGMGHRAPTFYLRGVRPAAEPRVLKEKHLSLVLEHRGAERRAIWFNGATGELPTPPWDIAFEVTRNEYQGRISPQIQLTALRAAEPR